MKMRFHVATKIAVGLAFLILGVALLAGTLGLIPDETGMAGRNRALLCENFMVRCEYAIARGDIGSIENLATTAYERDNDILSLGVRTASGRLIAEAGPHQNLWGTGKPDASTLRVDAPIFLNGKEWGKVEFAFSDGAGVGLTEMALDPETRLALFISLLSLLGIMLVLRRVFRHLNPATVIPNRVKSLLDTLAEGILVLDPEERIVIVNRSFCSAVGLGEERLVGRKISRIAWKQPESSQPTAEFPWRTAARQRTTQRGVCLMVHSKTAGARFFSVSASPIMDEGKHWRGVLVSLDDVTMLRNGNGKMADSVKRLENARNLVGDKGAKRPTKAPKHAA